MTQLSKKSFLRQILSDLSTYQFVVLSGALLLNEVVYYAARLLAGNMHHFSFALSLDYQIPLIPWTVTVYFGCFLIWGINYALISLGNRQESDRFFCADALSKLFCFVFFLLLPTTMERPDVIGTDFFSRVMRFLYLIDEPNNLFPSIHCLVSWLCWIGVRKNDRIPRAYRRFSLFAAMAVCCVTLTTRQHVILDVISGVLLAEVSYYLSGFPKICSLYQAAVHKIVALFSKKRT